MTGSPSSSAGLCRPTRSPGKAGRSRGPGALSYSSMCFQTEGGKQQEPSLPYCSIVGSCESEWL
uniref:Uncharacterized protein n=1 Tax=Amphiprion ocellaris TaxID=80972 RepID=A0AAQ6AI31_AMPOC